MENFAYKHLFTPIQLNKTMIKNRIVATPVGSMVEAAKGGAGIVISHTLPMDMRNSFWSNEPYAFSKYNVEGARDEVYQVHRYGAKAAVELLHCGAVVRVPEGEYALGPSEMVNDYGSKVKAMTYEDMCAVADAYGRMAREARDIGYDIIFLHFAHGWLPAQFISPLYNKRTDEYGGPIENRAKFPCMILEAVRKAVGPDFPIDMRISSVEHVPGSIDFEDTLKFIKIAEPYINSVQISCGLDMGFHYEGNVTMATTIFEPHYINVDYAARVKQEVNIPVYAVGGFSDPDEAEAILASGKVDMIAIGRQMVADNQWPNKLLEGRKEDIRPCIRCLYCYHIATNHQNVGCSVNPCYKHEAWLPAEEDIVRNETPRKVVVVGAGPAGIKAALTADRKGNDVVLIEKANEVGGMLRYISKEHYKEDIVRYLDYLKDQLKKSNVDLRLNTEATPEMIKSLEPDYLIVAVGSSEIKPRIPGSDQDFVYSELNAIENEKALGDKVVVIGGGTIGAELALGLAEKEHKDVTVVEMSPEIAGKGNMLYRISMRQHMDRLDNLHLMTNTVCKEIGDHKVTVEKDGQTVELECDNVVIAIGVRSNRDLANTFYGICPNTRVIGDCSSVRLIMEATFEGYVAGLETN